MTSDAAPGYLSADDCRLADLIDLVSQKTDLADYPYAAAVEQNMLIYDGARLRKELSGPAGRLRVEAELARALLDRPGIVVLAGAFGDPWVVDRATRQFEAIIAAQRAAGGAAGDHFAAAGQNDRIWNALEKLALRARRCSRTTTPRRGRAHRQTTAPCLHGEMLPWMTQLPRLGKKPRLIATLARGHDGGGGTAPICRSRPRVSQRRQQACLWPG